MQKDEIKEILDRLKDSATNQIIDVPVMGGVSEPIDNSQCLEPNECKILLDYITNLQQKIEKLENDKRGMLVQLYKANDEKDKLKQENEKLKREVAKLHIIQEEYGNHIENTHIIDDYQKTYFMTNKYLIELKNGKFAYVDELKNKYEDYKSRYEKAIEYIKKVSCNGKIYFYTEDSDDVLGDLSNILQGNDKE